MIHKDNGDITTSLGTISSKLSYHEFKKTALFNQIIDKVEHQNGHCNYKMRNIEIDKQTFIITLYFYENRLIFSSLFYSTGKIPDPSWSDWTLEQELNRKKFHDDLLTRWLGDEKVIVDTNVIYHLPWGNVSSGYNPLSASSSISIKYY